MADNSKKRPEAGPCLCSWSGKGIGPDRIEPGRFETGSARTMFSRLGGTECAARTLLAVITTDQVVFGHVNGGESQARR
jgi:hypothetical protein